MRASSHQRMLAKAAVAMHWQQSERSPWSLLPPPRNLAPWKNLPSLCILQTLALKITIGASDTF